MFHETPQVRVVKWLSILVICAVGFVGGNARAEDQPLGPVSVVSDISAHEIISAIYRAPIGQRVDFSGHHLAYLDLSELNFKRAVLARSDLYGTDFTRANLTGVDLSNTRLDRSVLIRTDLSGADLTGATILRPTVFSDMSNDLGDAPRFAGAKLRRVRVQANLSGADFRGADMTDADFSPLEARPGQGTLVTLPKNVLKSCDFSGAQMHNANLTRAVLWFARFTGADLTGVSFVEADLSRADFAGADLTGADMTGADVDGANFVGARGFETVRGRDSLINLDKARH